MGTTARTTVVAVLVLGLAACGGDDDAAPEPPAADEEPAVEPVGADDADADGTTDGDIDDGDGDGDGDDEPAADQDAGANGIAEPQPPGQAYVAVDGQEFTLTEPGAVDCTVSEDAITFGFRIGDNEVTLGAGANRSDDQWLGDIRLTLNNVPGQEGPTTYSPDLAANPDRLVVDGDSASYSGPMLLQPPNDGSNPPAFPVGNGIVSITCG